MNTEPVKNKAVIGKKCWYCGAPAFNVDHRIPQSRMRGVGPGNKVPACKNCNSVKGNFTVEEFRAHLKEWDASGNAARRPTLWAVIRTIKPHNFVFHGERGWAKDFDAAQTAQREPTGIQATWQQSPTLPSCSVAE